MMLQHGSSGDPRARQCPLRMTKHHAVGGRMLGVMHVLVRNSKNEFGSNG